MQVLTTELNGLQASPSNILSVPGLVFDMPTRPMIMSVYFEAGDAAFRVWDGGFLDLWLLKSMDNGTHWEDGNYYTVPKRQPDVILATPEIENPHILWGVYPAFALGHYADLPPLSPIGKVRALVRNQTGWALPVRGNAIIIDFSEVVY